MSKPEAVFQNVRDASFQMHTLSDHSVNQILNDVAATTIERSRFILAENEKDLAKMSPENPRYDRLKLTFKRLEGIAHHLRDVAKLPSPLGKTLDARTLQNGLQLRKVTVPIGVIGIIYEARPNVTFDVFGLCIKSGNTCLLKGGKDAEHSNQAIISVIHEVLVRYKVSPHIVQLLPVDRVVTEQMLRATEFVDLIIPRGSQSLINFVRNNAKVPVIETGAGIVHTYFDESADLEKGKNVILNAKTRRVSVCNALDCLLIHHSRVNVLPEICRLLAEHHVEIYADESAYLALQDSYPKKLLHFADEEHYGMEFLDYKMAIKTVSGLDGAIEHINHYSSRHSEAILSETPKHIESFLNRVDAAVVYVNASTAFTDGAQFGLGAEIGISTQKMHARGPMGLAELTSYKWLVKGDGHTRPA